MPQRIFPISVSAMELKNRRDSILREPTIPSSRKFKPAPKLKGVSSRFQKAPNSQDFGLFTKSFAGSKPLYDLSPRVSRAIMDHDQVQKIYRDNQPIQAQDLVVLMNEMEPSDYVHAHE